MIQTSGERLDSLNQSYKLLGIVDDEFKGKFDLLASKLSHLPFSKVKVSVGKQLEIKITLLFSCGLLMLTKIIDDEDIIFSYFENGELVVSNILGIDQFVDSFLKFLNLI
jgi:hypothetical protein